MPFKLYLKFINNISTFLGYCSLSGGKQLEINSVIIVDDEKEIRDMLSTILKDNGYLVETVENGKQALKACEKGYFDVALLDIELPDIKGTELLQRLKEAQPKMVNIIMTGHPSIENAVKSVNNKADGYVLKPFDITLLLETMKKCIASKTNAYFQMFAEVERAKKNTPIFKYQQPDKW
jgi:DNA-binding NtrC family response regulator